MDQQDKNIANEDHQQSHEEEGEAWVIKSIADNAKPPPSPIPRIPRVPTSMVTETRDYNKYYVPKVVSIGPYHSRNANLKFIENLKPDYAKKLLSLHSQSWEVHLRSLYRKLGEPSMVQRLRNFYQEKSTDDFSDEAFTKMMILDACFILYYIIYMIYGDQAETCSLNRHQIVSVYQDLFLLENQIPFQVLIEVMNLMEFTLRVGDIKTFIDDNFLASERPKRRWLFGALRRRTSGLEVEVDHLLQFLHRNLITAKRSRSYKTHRCIVHNANELIDVGIKFKRSRAMSLSEIGFYRSWCFFSAKLVLPPIVIEPSTKPMLLNLIAHEMCSDEGREAWVTSCVCFLHSLINKSEDVDALRKAGVLDHSLGSDNEVVKMLNEIGADLMPNIAAYSEVKNKLQHHYESWTHTPISKVKRDYMKSPWVFAFLGAVIALFLSAVQTYFTVWSPKGECDDLCKFLKINHHL